MHAGQVVPQEERLAGGVGTVNEVQRVLQLLVIPQWQDRCRLIELSFV